MARLRAWARMQLATLTAFVLAFFAGPLRPALAEHVDAPVERNVGAESPVRGETRPPALTLPQDVPVIVSPSQINVPPVPDDYVTKDLGWLRFSYPPAAAERVAPLLRDANAIKEELSSALGLSVLGQVEVRITPTTSDMARLAPREVPPPEYADGVAYPRLRLILISMLAPRGAEAVELDRVFRHELAHVALEDAVLGQHVPVWFNEGFAMALSGEKAYDRMRVLWNATVSDTVLPLSELDRSFPSDTFEVNIAYAESADFMAFLMRKADRERFAAMVRRVREGTPFERAMSDAYGSDLRKLEFQWRTDLERRYSLLPILTGGGILWVGAIGVLGAAYAKRRRRSKAILEQWGREEAMEDALRARLAAQIAAEEAEENGEEHVLGHVSARPLSSRPPMIEHGGHWHTLH